MAEIIETYMRRGTRAHLVGIGGVSMAALAEVLHDAGLVVTGSDAHDSAAVQRLRELGIHIAIGHHADSVKDVQCVIRTAAVHDDNPEIAAAHQKQIPVFERAQAWGAIMKQYQNALCIAGTHGKTTTTSMCTQIFLAAQLDPTVMIGGTLPALGASHRVGKGDTIILESCEYCNSFLSFSPTIAVILNVEADHLDFFSGLADIQQSFRKFAQLVPGDGTIVANGEDANTMQALKGVDRTTVTFGMTEGTVHGENLIWVNGFADFDLVYDGAALCHIRLNVPGVHNLKNALAAAAAALVMKIAPEAIAKGLETFTGAGRRFEYKGTYHGAKVYDDYAHHPSELKALLDAAKNLGYERVICAFQPHTYTRTQEFFEEFVDTLKLADQVVLAEIYAAREVNDSGMSSQQLAKEIPGAIYCETLQAMTKKLAELAMPGDLILTVGAGDIYQAGEAMFE